ncbi:hypothetical protein HPP92_008456 [Vanilla planifolia]|uniref:Uncharacterized protein n=1 Tax=Vanilla planifolia TaxID=51239 RepID=A0A835RED3_VANPL|nr:hypothetical protein HPP92_008456 [Vanilla planifolia]
MFEFKLDVYKEMLDLIPIVAHEIGLLCTLCAILSEGWTWKMVEGSQCDYFINMESGGA